MATVDTGLGEVEVRATPFALMVYEQEFGGRSLVADLMGDPEAFRDAQSGRWLELCRALWACMRAADESVGPFVKWAREADGMDLWAVYRQLVPVLADGLFRPRASAGGDE